ncbi:MAG: hypothetical protein PHQ01_02610 [Candidatus Pacebacteria bacterium]|nr:hypothetical protein [Candidatus Paceibacterota bacterium]
MINEEHINQIQKALGKNNNCLGGNYYFNFSDEELKEFLQNMNSENRDKFNRLVCYYYIYMESLSFLRSYEVTKEDLPIKYLYYNVWSNIAISVIFSLVEKNIPKSKTITFVKFLKNNFEDIKKEGDIDILSAKHKKLNNSIIEHIYSFYCKNLLEEDKKNIEKCFNKSFKEIIKYYLYGQIRSGLVHSLNIRSLPQYETGFDIKGSAIKVSNELNAEKFIYLSWKAIFKYFGYSKNL